MRTVILLGLRLALCGLGLAGYAAGAQPRDPGIGAAGEELERREQPRRVVIEPTTPNPAQVLIAALSDRTSPKVVVELGCDLSRNPPRFTEIDLTGHSLVGFGANHRSLIASPHCARGLRSLGPLIRVNDRRPLSKPLFVIRADHVRISGFRLQGPTSDERDDAYQAIGIKIWPSGEERDPGRECGKPGLVCDIEISNMEITRWSGGGIQVGDFVDNDQSHGRLVNTNVGAVRIENNYFHRNRHDGQGYGVDVGGGAYALIQRNVFDHNRHAIAGGSRERNDFSGYTARENLILGGGGLACSHGVCWQTHQIDMHGDTTKWGYDSCCGIAGETLIIERNTILYTASYAIKIRGNPADKAVVDGNIFRHPRSADAIDQNGDPVWGGLLGDNITNPIDIRPNNVYGADPTSELGRCDFHGDGRLDTFMATGVTWWAKSAVTGQWRYLNTMPERLAQLRLEKFDGDAVCDVLPRTPRRPDTLYSKSGTGPWASLLGPSPGVAPPTTDSPGRPPKRKPPTTPAAPSGTLPQGAPRP